MSDFRDAEYWLRARGVERDPIRAPDPSAPSVSAPGDPPPVSEREATRLARASSMDAPLRAPDDPQPPPRDPVARGDLGDEVAAAVAYARRSTGHAPKSVARLTEALRRRGYPAIVVEQAIARCRAEGVVDDDALARALVDEGRAKGHAPRRLRADLERRGVAAAAAQRALDAYAMEDVEAAAFGLARDRAERLRHLDTETAFRRLVGWLGRRGYGEALARKVAREAVFTSREQDRIAGH